MNQSKTLQKLVSLLGDSENDPKLQALFIELGEKFPLRRPRKGDTGYLLEKENRSYQLAMKYADAIPHCQNSCHPHPNNLNGGKGDNHGTIQCRTQTSNIKQTAIA